MRKSQNMSGSWEGRGGEGRGEEGSGGEGRGGQRNSEQEGRGGRRSLPMLTRMTKSTPINVVVYALLIL